MPGKEMREKGSQPPALDVVIAGRSDQFGQAPFREPPEFLLAPVSPLFPLHDFGFIGIVAARERVWASPKISTSSSRCWVN
jgi:hypothetical protein